MEYLKNIHNLEAVLWCKITLWFKTVKCYTWYISVGRSYLCDLHFFSIWVYLQLRGFNNLLKIIFGPQKEKLMRLHKITEWGT